MAHTTVVVLVGSKSSGNMSLAKYGDKVFCLLYGADADLLIFCTRKLPESYVWGANTTLHAPYWTFLQLMMHKIDKSVSAPQ